MSKKNNKIEIPDVFGDALLAVINEAHKRGELVSGFVVLLETYDGKKKRMRTVPSPGLTEYQTFGMINYANVNFEYALPDDDDDEDFDDYNPNWYWNQ